MQTLEYRFWLKVRRRTFGSCWEWSGAKTKSKNYGVLQEGPRGGKLLRAHRVSWTLHNGPIPEGLCVLHRCDNPSCVNPLHLFLGTIADNNADMARKGRATTARGEQHPRAKLTARKIKAIRDTYFNGVMTQPQLAKKYGVHNSQISRIVNGLAWS